MELVNRLQESVYSFSGSLESCFFFPKQFYCWSSLCWAAVAESHQQFAFLPTNLFGVYAGQHLFPDLPPMRWASILLTMHPGCAGETLSACFLIEADLGERNSKNGRPRTEGQSRVR